MVLLRREFIFDIRNLLFLMGLFGTTLYATTLLMRMQTYMTRVVEMCSSFLNTMAFHVLLYLWSVFVMQIRRHRSIYYLRVFIVFGALTMTFSIVFSGVMLNMVPTAPLASMSIVVSYWVPITQMILALMFLVYALNFRQRRKGLQISEATNDALNRLQWLAGIAFIAYMALAFTNLHPITAMMTTPATLAAIIVLRTFAASIRGIALISVMGVRVPSRATSAAVMTFHDSTMVDSHIGSGYAVRKGSAWNTSEAGSAPTITRPVTPMPTSHEKGYPVGAYAGSGSWPMHRPLHQDSDVASSVDEVSVTGDGMDAEVDVLSETTQRDAYAYLRDDPYASWQPQQYEQPHAPDPHRAHDADERV